MSKIYTVFNHETKEQLTITEETLENYYPELKLGKLEIVDEIDNKPFILSYDSATTLNQCVASLWEVIAFHDELSKSEILQILEVNLKQVDSALKCVES